MPSLESRVLRKFAAGILRTTWEKWLDGFALVVTIVWEIYSKPTTVWQYLAPPAIALCATCALHLVTATYEVWNEIRKQPRVREFESPILLPNAGKRKILIPDPVPPYFTPRLIGMLLAYSAVLGVVAIGAKRAEDESLRTYIYLVPTAELIECQKRAFFVKTVGPQVLYNVEIELKDNKSGTTVSQKYPEIDPGPQSPDMYFWFSPSSRWDEDYTATVGSRDSHSSQNLVVRATRTNFNSQRR